MVFHCVGCGRSIPWDGEGIFAYTCCCGGILIADEQGRLCYPVSLIRCLVEGRQLPHIDYYLGFSNYISTEKERICEELKKLGAIWSWECPQCRERYLQRKKMQLEDDLISVGLHRELQALITEEKRDRIGAGR